MIPRAHITAWRAKVPWATDAQVEQDLVVCRALIDLFSHELIGRELAFRGGTALHKLHFKPARRYSEDIDLVQVKAGPIGPVMDATRAALDPWLGKPQWKQGPGRVTFYYRFDSETKPITPLKLKVETNTREHLCVFGPRRARFELESRWYSGSADIQTYELEELLATKLRALYQRKKGRDLFDLSEALVHFGKVDLDKVVACFTRYMEHEGGRVTRADLETNLADKISDDLFLSDVPPLLAPGASYDVAAAYQRVRDALVSKLPEGRSSKKRRRAREQE